jgi:ribosomal protein S18
MRSRRRTRTAARDQRKVTQAVKRARHMALLPFTSEQERASRGRRRG